ncbi:MAG: single-stranded DNA-binding protein [Thermomonas sp.]|uniref:single-stranded DNA-binding protein n=1 Tax=Thermomonas sp. TaxID=1971895 RepID=UPI0039E3EEB6
MSINICTFKGRIGRDAVTRYTQGGKAVTGFSLAVDIGWGDNKATLWIECNIWGERGEKLAQHLLKGTSPTVSGELGTREHDGKTYITLNVREIEPEWQKEGAAKPAANEARRNAPRQQAAPVDDFVDDIPF